MPFSLVRVDDRTIHGQVVVGWSNYIHPHRIILCNDEIAATEWEKDLYESSFSDTDTQINVFNCGELQHYVQREDYSRERCILLVENLRDAIHLLNISIPFNTLNIGGLHYTNGKRGLTDYIFLNDDDIKCFAELKSRGITIEGQDLPGSKKIDVMKLIQEKF